MTCPGSGSPYWADNSAQLGYDIDFETAGTYYIWMRRWATSSADNSCWIGLEIGLDGTQITDGETNRFDNYNGYYDQWYWRAYQVGKYISAGSHTFEVRRREPDYRIDRIILTADGNHTPSGTGPDTPSGTGPEESSRE